MNADFSHSVLLQILSDGDSTELRGYALKIFARELLEWRMGKRALPSNPEPLSFHDHAVLAAMQGILAGDPRVCYSIPEDVFKNADAICAERAKRKAANHGPA